ncbi:MAG TPA: hypothetical protein VF230_01685 [Acidimicrobiales bacterium]
MDVVLKLVIGLAFAYAVMRVGMAILRAFANPLPAPPPPGEMRRVNVRFRCSICGVEVRMTAAPNEEPEAPRHCQEDMELVAPVE